MRSNIKNIGVFTSGGDSPGMNAALYGIIKTTIKNEISLIGIRKGFDGMINGDFIALDARQLQGKVHTGGTYLKTARSERFRTVDGRKLAQLMLDKIGIDALIAIGGDGTFKGLLEFAETSDIPFIGIPGTIDNDLFGTDYTLGFDSAVNTAIQNIDKIRDTAESHNRIFIIEVMGRDSGYIGIHAGLGTGADAILIPESEEDISNLLSKVKYYDNEDAFIVVLSEGDEISAELLARKINEINNKVDLRITRIGHVQRGGNPSAFDRILGIKFGVAAVQALLHGEQKVMAGLINNRLTLTPFEKVVKQHKIDTDLQLLLEIFGK